SAVTTVDGDRKRLDIAAAAVGDGDVLDPGRVRKWERLRLAEFVVVRKWSRTLRELAQVDVCRIDDAHDRDVGPRGRCNAIAARRHSYSQGCGGGAAESK